MGSSGRRFAALEDDGAGAAEERALDNVLSLCLFVAVPPGKGASGGVWLQGGIGERGFGWRQPDLSEAVVLRSEGREA